MQKQDSLDNISPLENKASMPTKKMWLTPELRVLPVPSSTQTGKIPQKTAETNGIYRKS